MNDKDTIYSEFIIHNSEFYPMFQKLRERLALLLIALLPFHALFVTFGTKLIEGQNHAPMAALAIWKEALLGLILMIGVVEILWSKRLAISDKRSVWRMDLIDGLILALLIVALTLFASGHPTSLHAFLLGFRYDFVPLVALVILRRVPWSDRFLPLAFKTLLWCGTIVAGYGLITIALPMSFFTVLGYSDLHSLYVADGPVAAFQQIGGSALRRLQSTMSGPNQLGLWLLLPLTIAMLKKQRGAFVLIIVALFATLSRDAVLAFAVIVTAILWKRLPHRKFFRVAGTVLAVACIVAVVSIRIAPSVLLRSGSTIDHITRPLESLRLIALHPLGLGLSAAGPASNRLHETCVFLKKGDDPSWASDRPQLCVFVGGKQVQPVSHDCDCPLLPENWYVQIGVELGVLGLVLYMALIIVILRRLTRGTAVIFLIFLAVSVAALFLHAWEDAALAYTLWMLIAAQQNPFRPRSDQ